VNRGRGRRRSGPRPQRPPARERGSPGARARPRGARAGALARVRRQVLARRDVAWRGSRLLAGRSGPRPTLGRRRDRNRGLPAARLGWPRLSLRRGGRTRPDRAPADSPPTGVAPTDLALKDADPTGFARSHRGRAERARTDRVRTRNLDRMLSGFRPAACWTVASRRTPCLAVAGTFGPLARGAQRATAIRPGSRPVGRAAKREGSRTRKPGPQRPRGAAPRPPLQRDRARQRQGAAGTLRGRAKRRPAPSCAAGPGPAKRRPDRRRALRPIQRSEKAPRTARGETGCRPSAGHSPLFRAAVSAAQPERARGAGPARRSRPAMRRIGAPTARWETGCAARPGAAGRGGRSGDGAERRAGPRGGRQTVPDSSVVSLVLLPMIFTISSKSVNASLLSAMSARKSPRSIEPSFSRPT